MDKPAITYAPLCDTRPEMENSVLANVYKLVLSRAHERGRLPDKSGPDDGTKVKEDSANEHHSR